MLYQSTRDFARQMDAEDPLRAYREQFHFPQDEQGQPWLYFTGNSLGLQPKKARTYVLKELDVWANLAVEGHFKSDDPWLMYHRLLAEPMTKIVGGKSHEITVMNALTVNLHLLMVSFYRPTATRYKILIEEHAFPSDQYAVASQLHVHGIDPDDGLVIVRARPGETLLRTEDILATIEQHGSELALVMMGGVNYYTGQVFDMAAITKAAHAQGSVVGFDLAHAAGNIPLHLHDWGVDFAVWCTYKYLNGGPGSLGGCFVHERHAQNPDLPRFEGWWGNKESSRFAMRPDFDPIAGAGAWQISNSPLLTLAALRASMDLFEAVGLPKLRAKSEQLTGYLEYLLDQRLGDRAEIITPRDPQQRGAQLSVRIFHQPRAVFEALIARHILCDWREPDAIRISPAPFYNSFEDVWRIVDHLVKITQSM